MRIEGIVSYGTPAAGLVHNIMCDVHNQSMTITILAED